MPEFLSAEWIDALDAAARRSRHLAAISAEGPVVIEQLVTDTPDGPISYRLVCDAQGARIDAETDPTAPAGALVVGIECDLDTAIAIARGSTNAQTALATGRWTVRGDFAALAARHDVLGALDDVFAEVRGATTYPVDEP